MIEWKKHSENPVLCNRKVLVKSHCLEHVYDKRTKDFIEYSIREFHRPYDKDPKKYNENFYFVLSLRKNENGKVEWLDVDYDFEWCELI